MGKSEPTSINIGLDVNLEYDKLIVANNFFFTSVATNLTEQLPMSKGSYGIEFVRRFYEGKGVLSNYFYFCKVSVEDLQGQCFPPLRHQNNSYLY